MTTPVRALLAGWFSFEEMGATAGDLLARDVVRGWLEEGGRAVDIALAPPFEGGVRWSEVDPSDYAEVVFVCGPFGNGPPLIPFLERFRECRWIGVNLSMLQDLEEWNPFDLLLERDSSRTANPDLSLLGEASAVPIVGVILGDPQDEYRERDRHEKVHAVIEEFIATRDLAPIRIDTRLDRNLYGLRSVGAIHSAIARMDLVVTTRLHGTVLALKNGRPPIAVDPVAGGAKITRQAGLLGWPVVIQPEDVSLSRLDQALDFCLSDEAPDAVRSCLTAAHQQLESVHHAFLAGLDR